MESVPHNGWTESYDVFLKFFVPLGFASKLLRTAPFNLNMVAIGNSSSTSSTYLKQQITYEIFY